MNHDQCIHRVALHVVAKDTLQGLKFLIQYFISKEDKKQVTMLQ